MISHRYSTHDGVQPPTMTSKCPHRTYRIDRLLSYVPRSGIGIPRPLTCKVLVLVPLVAVSRPTSGNPIPIHECTNIYSVHSCLTIHSSHPRARSWPDGTALSYRFAACFDRLHSVSNRAPPCLVQGTMIPTVGYY